MVNRREFVTHLVRGVSLSVLSANLQLLAGEPVAKSRIKAIAFDAFPIFDPRSVDAMAESLFSGKGTEPPTNFLWFFSGAVKIPRLTLTTTANYLRA